MRRRLAHLWTPFSLLLSAWFLCGCQPAAPPAQSDVREQSANRLEAPAEDVDGVLRVLVMHDMEGLSGQDDTETFLFRKADRYAVGREALMADVNAVIAGLFEGGADEVHTVDGHGSGNPEPDLLRDLLDPRAEMVFRDEPFRQYVDVVEPGVYDAVAVVGMHAKSGSRGFASHTYTLGIEFLLNDRSVTETEIVGFSFGRVGTPVIFASGDDRLGKDLETMPWLEFVEVKRATSAGTAELRPVEEARADLRAAARRSVESLSEARAMRIGTPVRAALHAVPPASLEVLKGVPGIEYQDETVSFEAADFQEAYDGLIALVSVATTNFPSLLFQDLQETPAGREVASRYSDLLFERWIAVESGHWSAPEPAAPVEGQRYHGAR